MTDVTDVVSGPVRRPGWVAHVLDDSTEPARAILLHLPSGRRTALSETATRVWQVIVAAGVAGVQVGGIADELAPEYGVDPTIIRHDVGQLLVEMLSGEWLEQVPDRPGPDQEHDQAGGDVT